MSSAHVRTAGPCRKLSAENLHNHHKGFCRPVKLSNNCGGWGSECFEGLFTGGLQEVLELCFVESIVDVFLSGFFLESFLEGSRISE